MLHIIARAQQVSPPQHKNGFLPKSGGGGAAGQSAFVTDTKLSLRKAVAMPPARPRPPSAAAAASCPTTVDE